MHFENKNLVFFIPFRKGSKGFPNKNLADISGISLYNRTIIQASEIPNGGIFVSTDYDIVDLNFSAQVDYIRREDKLCRDSSTMTAVIRDFLIKNTVDSTTVVLLQVTSPLRLTADILRALSLYDSENFDLVFTVTQTSSEFLKYGFVDSTGKFLSVSKSEYCFYNRQELPPTYRPNGMVYVFNSGQFIKNGGFPTDNIGVVTVPTERSIDIDSPQDLEIAISYLSSKEM